jgi:hypothetical protein
MTGTDMQNGGAQAGDTSRVPLIHPIGKYDWGLRHDFDWVIRSLDAAYGGGQTAMLSGVDWYLAEGKKFPDAWVGIYHQPLSSFPPCVGLVDLKKTLVRLGALKSCRGIFTLTEFQKSFLDGAGLGVPVCRLWLPIPAADACWNPALWQAKRRIVFVGRWIRRLQAIQELHCPGVEKLWLSKQAGSVDGVVENGTVTRIDYLAVDAYDRLMTSCIAMTEVIEAAANNVVLECIARRTPLLVNWNTGVVEYLGAGYPLYYGSMAEANWKAGDERLVLAAYEYLCRMDTGRFTIDRFLSDFGSSSICDNLRAQAGRRSHFSYG